jgi:predicted regulator of Ras-like GTPase activity (Roadblock/LC7/MglB family)
MDIELSNALPSLRDVEGVLASFVVSDQSEVIARDVALYIEDAALSEVAPRLGRFHEAMSSNGDFLDLFVLEYEEQALHARRLPNGFLCLITSHNVNAPSLRMAINLMARKVGDRIARHKATELRTPLPTATTLPTMRTLQPSPPSKNNVSRITSPPMPRQTPAPGMPRATSIRPVAAESVAEPAAKPVRYYRGRAVVD